MRSLALISACIILAGSIAVHGKNEFVEAGDLTFTQKKLHSVVVDLIKSKEIELTKPVLVEDGEIIKFNLGGFRRSSRAEDRSPLEIPVDTQCIIESVRQHFSTKAERRVWKPHLEKVEAIIEKQLRLIAENKDGRKKLMGALLKLEGESQTECQAAMSELAKAKMKKAVPFMLSEGALYQVTIKTDPKAAAVFYLTEADYMIYTKMGIADRFDKWQEHWIEAANRELRLGGNYRFRARWPDDKTRKTAKVIINKDTPIELAPE